MDEDKERAERRSRLREILNQTRIMLNFANSARLAQYEFREFQKIHGEVYVHRGQ